METLKRETFLPRNGYLFPPKKLLCNHGSYVFSETKEIVITMIAEFPPECPLLHLGLALLAAGDPAPVVDGVLVVRHPLFCGISLNYPQRSLGLL